MTSVSASGRWRAGTLRLLLCAMWLWALLPVRGLAVCFGEDGHLNAVPRLVAGASCPCDAHAPDDGDAPHGPCRDVGIDKTDAVGDSAPPAAADLGAQAPPPSASPRPRPHERQPACRSDLPLPLPPPRIPRVLRI